jgi:dTDP-4-amino-4,6-dideoxygalactose transaminase
MEELDGAYRRVMESGWYVLGGEVEAFEREWADWCGTSHCVGVGTGLSALELVLRAWELGAGDEVIVPANSYIASWLAVTAIGAQVVPVEPERLTSNIDSQAVELAITPRTRAVMVAHLYGQCAHVDPILEVARRHGLRVLEDAAQAHGATYRGRRAGGLADAAAWSYYPTKNLGCYGDGGAVTTNDPDLADRLRLLRNYGSRRKYSNEVVGTNSRLDELQAAFLRVRLRHLEEWNDRREATARQYTESLVIPDLRLPVVPEFARHVWHVYAVHYPLRDRLQELLAEKGVQTLIFYPVPPHLSPAYADRGWSSGDFPVTEELARTTLALPVGPFLPPDHIDYVIDSVRTVAGKLAARV